jgi:transcriptional regulator with XRE-family HTH domain
LEKFTLTSEQIRAARMLLRWRQVDLAKKSGISEPVVKRVESEPGEIRASPYTIEAFRRAFEKERIIFISSDFRGAVIRENRGRSELSLRKSRGLKRAKAVKVTIKKRAAPQSNGLK